jgi:hypothetical protein
MPESSLRRPEERPRRAREEERVSAMKKVRGARTASLKVSNRSSRCHAAQWARRGRVQVSPTSKKATSQKTVTSAYDTPHMDPTPPYKLCVFRRPQSNDAWPDPQVRR